MMIRHALTQIVSNYSATNQQGFTFCYEVAEMASAPLIIALKNVQEVHYAVQNIIEPIPEKTCFLHV